MHLHRNLIMAALVAAASLGAIGAAPAQARTSVYLGIGVGAPPVGYYYDPYLYRERRYRDWDRARWMRYRFYSWHRAQPEWRGYERARYERNHWRGHRGWDRHDRHDRGHHRGHRHH